MKTIKAKSGLTGWQAKLRKVYHNFKEFAACCETYGNHIRLGYATPASAWRHNPTVQGSVNPSDYCKVLKNGRRVYVKDN